MLDPEPASQVGFGRIVRIDFGDDSALGETRDATLTPALGARGPEPDYLAYARADLVVDVSFALLDDYPARLQSLANL